MKLSAKALTFILVIFSLSFAGCESDDEKDEGYSFEVISYKGEFEGYYKVDDSPALFFTSSVAEGNANYHCYNQKIKPDYSVYISATATDTSATSMQIHLYRDGQLLETATFSQTTDSTGTESVVNGTLQYTIDTSGDEKSSE